MNDHYNSKQDGTITTKVVCAISFLLFSFLWLFELQADALAVAQHVLSQGHTHYEKVLGSLIIVSVLYLVQFVVAHVGRIPRRTYALTYFPSLLILAFLSDFVVDDNHEVSVSTWYWLFPLLLVLWGGAYGWRVSSCLFPIIIGNTEGYCPLVPGSTSCRC